MHHVKKDLFKEKKKLQRMNFKNTVDMQYILTTV